MNTFGVGLLVALVIGALIFTFVVMTRASKGYDRARDRRAAAGPTPACSTCRSTLMFIGLLDLHVGDDTEAAGNLAVSQGKLPLEAYRCPTCRKLETFLPPLVG